jgi:Cd2+/Zn2+-exporting ATPase
VQLQRQGVLVKGGNYLEALSHVQTVVFDKTGTLTKGVFKVTEANPSNGFTAGQLMEFSAYAESYSSHPIALSILAAYGSDIDRSRITEYQEVAGNGIKATIAGKQVLAGNTRLMQEHGIDADDVDGLGTVVHVAVDHTYVGNIVISDEVKEDAARAVGELKSLGVQKTVMLTGDLKAVGDKIGKQLGLDEVYSDLLPADKVEKLESLEAEKPHGGKVVFVGDGINDAPVLVRADIGIAMGGLGSDAAVEAADVVIMTDEPSKIATAIRIAKRTRGIVMQNVVLALSVKALFLLLGATGEASMWEAVFADVGVTIIAVLNAMRAMTARQDREAAVANQAKAK